MKSNGRLMVFSLIASVAYTLAYYFDWSLFQYYLAENRIHVTPQGDAAGPPILWYGWLATAVLAGGVGALIIPKRLTARFLPDLIWVVPVVLIAAALLYEKRWFI